MKKEPKNEYFEKKLKLYEEKIRKVKENERYVFTLNFLASTIQELQKEECGICEEPIEAGETYYCLHASCRARDRGKFEWLIERMGDDFKKLVKNSNSFTATAWKSKEKKLFVKNGNTSLEALQALKKELEK